MTAGADPESPNSYTTSTLYCSNSSNAVVASRSGATFCLVVLHVEGVEVANNTFRVTNPNCSSSSGERPRSPTLRATITMLGNY